MDAADRRTAVPLPIRAHPLVFGVVLFLASELMLFAAMFAAYFDLRSLAAVWPPSDVRLHSAEAAVGTFVLALSSAAVVGAGVYLRREDIAGARSAIAGAIFLGVAFLAIAVHGWSTASFHISSHAYGSLFYIMTGFHAAHVLAGIVLLTVLLLAVCKPAMRLDDRAGFEAISYYWHFVFIVWLGIWSTIYLIR